jgi:hypothetical protein
LNLVSYHPRTVEYVQGRKKQFPTIHFLPESPYIPGDSVVAEQRLADDFAVNHLRSLGWYGWRVVGIAPKTVGIGLTNSSIGASTGQTWGAGLGGNVAGVYVLLEIDVRPAQAESLRPTIQEHLERAL